MLVQHIGCNQFIVQTDSMLVVEAIIDGGFSTTRTRRFTRVVLPSEADSTAYLLSIVIVRLIR
jgi:hypothetical protein